MDSKEWIKGVLYNLEETLDIAKETKNKDLEIDCKMQKEAYNQVLKDLEDYEELLKIMGTPIEKIMKKLKVLEILKKWFMDYITDYRDYDNTLFVDTFIREDEPIFEILKEWLDNGKD